MTDLEKHVNRPGRDKLVKKVREKIDELGITYSYYQFISVTGRFVGKGMFSGPMVNPGSFYQTGIVPGEYDAFVNLTNGKEVKLPQTVSVGLEPSYDISLTMPGPL